MGVAKYIINFDELVKSLPGLDTSGLEDFLNEILDLLRQLLKSEQNQSFRSVDMSKHIPAIVNTFIISKSFEQDIYLTGITFSQTAWKVEDTISLELNGSLIIDHIHTKELGQQKYFNAFIPVKAGDEIRILYHNASGNSKMFFCDLDYIFTLGEENNHEF